MANEKKAWLTEEQRAALKPLFQKIESAYDELEKAVAALRSGSDVDFGFCISCPRPGRQDTCSSFLGHGSSPRELCQRDFCKHPLVSHF
jgi:hypothetical protein